MTAQLASDLTHSTEQPYLARRQNWVNQLERHALMQPNATALRFLGKNVTWDGLHRRVVSLADAFISAWGFKFTLNVATPPELAPRHRPRPSRAR